MGKLIGYARVSDSRPGHRPASHRPTRGPEFAAMTFTSTTG